VTRSFLNFACLFCIALLGFVSVTGLAHAQTNIIHFFIDDLGWTDTSAPELNGGNQSLFHQTPNIEQLASQGMTFTSAYAVQTCTPSRASLMTGQYAPRTGVYNVSGLDNLATSALRPPANLQIVQDATDTVAERLQGAGYVTGHFGKFDVTSVPNDITSQHGFDFNFGGGNQNGPGSYFPTQNGGNWTYGSAVSAGVDPYAEPYDQAYIDNNLAPYANGADVNSLLGTPKHLTDATTDAAVDFIADRANSGEVFYMNMAYHAIHSPFQGRSDLVSKYEGIIAANGGSSPDPGHTDTDIAALTEGVDQGIARVLASLDDPNGDGSNADSILADTLIVFSGDNGSLGRSSSAPLTGSKGSQSEGGLRVPLLVYQPGTIEPGTTDVPVHVVDFYPTFVEAGGGTLPNATTQPIDGESLLPLLDGDASTNLDRNGVFFHFPGYSANGNNVPTSTIVKQLAGGTKNVKLQYDIETRTYAQYDLTADISESNDLANLTPTVSDFRDGTRLAAELATWLADTGADMPTLRGDGTPVPLPSHTPQFQYALNSVDQPGLQGQTASTVSQLGVELTVGAVGNNAVLDLSANGIGVNSGLDTGGAVAQSRIDGSLATPEALEFSFDQDVVLKSLVLNAVDTSGMETVSIDFVSGDNPFTGLSGYAGSEYVVGATGLEFTQTAGNQNVTLDFGILARDEILLTAGTVLALSTNPADTGGILLRSINIARPLSDANLILADMNLDGSYTCSDLDALSAAVAAGTNDVDFDLTGDGVVDNADVTEWLAIAGAAQLASGASYAVGDVDLDGNVDSTDLGVLLNNFADNSTLDWCSGNLDADISVDSTDLGLLLNNFGVSVAAAVAVPEPEMHWMLVLVPLFVLRRRRS